MCLSFFVRFYLFVCHCKDAHIKSLIGIMMSTLNDCLVLTSNNYIVIDDVLSPTVSLLSRHYVYLVT